MTIRASDSMDGDTDRISTLPDYLIHQILSYLDSDEEAARTCVLSKRWLQSHSTSPNLTFNQSFYSALNAPKNQQPMFFWLSFLNSVYNTLLRYQSLNLTIHKLKIILSFLDAFTSPLLDKSLRLAFDIGVQDLFISLRELPEFSPLPELPSSMFEYPNVVTSLTVKYFRFPENVISNAIMFPFLKTLYLHMVHIDDEILQKLLSRSPSLEKVILFHVYGLTNFRVSNLGELKIIDITMGLESLDRYQGGIEKFEIDIEEAPSLSYLRFSSHFVMTYLDVPFLLKVDSVPNLKDLEFQNVNINDNDLKELVTKLPLLENLKIVGCEWLKRIDIASSSLKHFWLSHCGVVEAKIDAPNLLKLEHNEADMLLLSLNNIPQELVSHRYRL